MSGAEGKWGCVGGGARTPLHSVASSLINLLLGLNLEKISGRYSRRAVGRTDGKLIFYIVALLVAHRRKTTKLI